MKKHYFLLLILATTLFGCTKGQIKTDLSAIEFSDKIKEMPNAPIIDVRTPEEFSKGHLLNAENINWNGGDFDIQIAKLDKSKPVLVYCLSGARSASAASKMRSDGFKEVYELKGGIMQWRAANFEETTNTTTQSTGMSKQQFDKLLNSDKLILIDFYADWCGPCVKMKPSLEEISKEMPDKVEVIRINVDENKELSEELQIAALPTLWLYKNKTLTWENTGYIKKADIIKQLK